MWEFLSAVEAHVFTSYRPSNEMRGRRSDSPRNTLATLVQSETNPGKRTASPSSEELKNVSKPTPSILLHVEGLCSR